MNKKLLDRIRVLFQEKLATKTGWGRNDVLTAYDQAVNEAVLELLDSAQ
jgi:hypothetical protein